MTLSKAKQATYNPWNPGKGRHPNYNPNAEYHHPLYRTWSQMHRRCESARSKDFMSYGGRGISVCERWSSFAAFVGDMGPRPEGRTLDRIDNDGNYEPGNCRWATSTEQGANKRTTRGERNGNSRLTETDVFVIRRVHATGVFSQPQLARWWGMSETNIADIVRRRTWRHVPETLDGVA